MTRRRARCRCHASPTAGTTRSHNSATMTIRVALRASSMAMTVSPVVRISAAGGSREEDDPLGVARNVVEGAHQPGLAPAAARLCRDGGQHAEVELVAELCDEPLLVLAQIHVTFGQEDLAVPGLHAQELHREPRLWQTGGAGRGGLGP